MLTKFLRRHRYTLTIFAFSRATLLLAVYIGLVVVPQMAPGEGHWRAFPDNLFFDGFARWDSGWYFALAESGYTGTSSELGQQNTAFFPAYPLLLSLAKSAGGKQALALWGVALSNMFFVAGLCFMHDLAARWASARTARLAVALAAFSPFAIFFSAVYTESLFFMTTTASFWLSLRGSLVPSMMAAAVAGVTRVVGVGIVPFAFLTYLQAGSPKGRWRPCDPASGWRLGQQFLAAFAIGCSLLAAHLLYLQFRYGSFLQFAYSQRGWWSSSSLLKDFLWTWAFILDLGRIPRGEVHVMGVANCLFGALALGLIIVGIARRKMPRTILFWSLLTMLVSSNIWFSAGRFATSLFPVYILSAVFFRGLPSEALIGCSAMLMALFAFFFSHWYWVA